MLDRGLVVELLVDRQYLSLASVLLRSQFCPVDTYVFTLVTTLLHSRQLLTNCGHRATFPDQNLLTLIKLRPLHVHVLSESITESLMTLTLSCKLMMPIIPAAMF